MRSLKKKSLNIIQYATVSTQSSISSDITFVFTNFETHQKSNVTTLYNRNTDKNGRKVYRVT
jgi:hypothetical protein